METVLAQKVENKSKEETEVHASAEYDCIDVLMGLRGCDTPVIA